MGFLFEPRPAGKKMAIAGYECVWCPPGAFQMGSSDAENGRRTNEALHGVILTEGFWMCDHPVTQAEYQAVMGDLPDQMFEGSNLPVGKVSWDEAAEFCRKLTLQYRSKFFDGLDPLVGWRLPVEAEWEYACRAGVNGGIPENLLETSWMNMNSGGEPHPVKGKVPNPWGLYDMIGNIYEWCWDWYGQYPIETAVDPAGPRWGSERVFRGGYWSSDACSCRPAERCSFAQIASEYCLGFRIVLSSRSP
jgi:formylglycine-generating enzyme required for sulfatase activity